MVNKRQPKVRRISKHKLQTNVSYFWKEMFDYELLPFQKVITTCRKPRIAIVGGRRSSKTFLFSGEAIRFAVLHPNQDVAIFADSWDTAKIFMDTAKDLIARGPLQDSVAQSFVFEIIFTNRSRIFAKTLSKTSKTARGHGRRIGFFGLDEAAYIPEECLAAVRPIRLDRKAREWQVSTPLGHNHFYRTWKSNKYESFRIKTSDNPYLDQEELEVDKELMTDLEFRQEYNAEFLDDAYIVFTEGLISAAIDNNLKWLERLPKEETNCIAALDIARKIDESVLIIADCKHPHINLLKIHVFPRSLSEKYWTNLIEQTCNLCRIFKVKRLLIDQTGIGDKPVIDIREKMGALGIGCAVQGIMIDKYKKHSSTGLMNQLLWKFERREFHFPYHKEFIRQLKNVRRVAAKTPNKIAKLTGNFETIGKDDIVSAASLLVEVSPKTTQFFYSKANKTSEREPREVLGGRVVSSAFNV